MKRPWFVALLMAACMASSTQAGGPGTAWDVELRARMEATGSILLDRDNPPGPPSYYVAATRERVVASPDWNANSLLPPLSLETALTIAHAELRRENPAYDAFQLTHAQLNRISGWDLGETKWWYSLHFYGSSPTHRDRSFLVPVLMDGTCLYPIPFEEEPARAVDASASGQRFAGQPGVDPGAQSELAERLSAIVIPEVDFRQAYLGDIVQFFDVAIAEHGAAAERSDETRLRIRIDESALIFEPHPYALPEDPPLLTFAAQNMSLREALKLTMELAELKMSVDGNVITLFNPKQGWGGVATNVTAASEPLAVPPATNAASVNARRPRDREMYEVLPLSDEQRRLMRAQHTGKDLLYDPRDFEEAKPTREAPASDIEVHIE